MNRRSFLEAFMMGVAGLLRKSGYFTVRRSSFAVLSTIRARRKR
jgi:hypothetical protein